VYWENVLQEVLNKHKKNRRCAFTNVGDCQAKPKNSQSGTLKKKRRSKKYYLGERYPGIYFTLREAECMKYIISGNTIVDTSKMLDLSHRTVEFYVNNMKAKIKCRTKSELVRYILNSDFEENLDF